MLLIQPANVYSLNKFHVKFHAKSYLSTPKRKHQIFLISLICWHKGNVNVCVLFHYNMTSVFVHTHRTQFAYNNKAYKIYESTYASYMIWIRHCQQLHNPSSIYNIPHIRTFYALFADEGLKSKKTPPEMFSSYTQRILQY